MSTPQLRSSQVITTFGPGAMVDLPDSAVIISGLDNWVYPNPPPPDISEPRLVAKLERLLDREGITLRPPPPAADDDRAQPRPRVTAWKFPNWYIVQKTEITKRGERRRRLVHRESLAKDRFVDVEGQKWSVVPVRFVRACEKGHIGDIDWRSFVHSGKKECFRELWVLERGTTGDLNDIIIECECGDTRPMSAAAKQDWSLGGCDGKRPWLGSNTRSACNCPNRLLIRSASNAYFSQILSVISIPDQQAPIDAITRVLWDDFLSDVETPAELAKARKKPTVAREFAGHEDDAIMASIQRVRNGGDDADRPVKEVEFEALSAAKPSLGVDEPDGDFYARALPPAQWQTGATWMKDVERVVLVHRLREVRALAGFTRFEASGPDIQGELDLEVERADIATDAKWIPATENRGEGIFIQFRREAIDEWLKKDPVKERSKEIAKGFMEWLKAHDGSKRMFPGMPYYMLHSLSHLLLTSIALECGYPCSSLKERIYASDGNYGILIYTGSSDAEGTLGGLVEAGREIKRHFRHALECGALCSNDPVCAHHEPSEHDHQPLLGSACHGCLLVSETCCEQHNEFLDRDLVVATVRGTGAEFFQL